MWGWGGPLLFLTAASRRSTSHTGNLARWRHPVSTYLSRLMALYRERLYIPEDIDIVVRYPFSMLLGFRFADVPPWGYLIGPPGGLKSTILLSMQDIPDVVCAGEWITRAGVMSGWRDDPPKKKKKNLSAPEDARAKFSLGPLVHDKMLVIHDWTQLTGSDMKDMKPVLNQLRLLFEGHASPRYGNIEGFTEERAHFSLIAGVTHEIDRIRTSQTALGERFLGFRYNPGPGVEDAARSIDNVLTGGKRWRDGLSKRIAEVVKDIPAVTPQDLFVSPAIRKTLTYMGSAAAWLRANVAVIHRGGSQVEVLYRPEPERATRIAPQALLVAMGHAILNRRTRLEAEDLALARSVLWGSIPDRPLTFALALHHAPNSTVAQISALTRYPPYSVVTGLESLVVLNVCTRERVENMGYYRLSNEFAEAASQGRFFEGELCCGKS